MLAEKYMHDSILREFDPIYLQDLDKDFLMKRKEVKYFFHQKHLYPILRFLSEEFQILEINKERKQSYQSHYLDTDDRVLYRNHHNGHDNRFKFRFRHYESSDMTFFEVKHKRNTGATHKHRVQLDGMSEDEKTTVVSRFVEEHTEYKLQDLGKFLDIDYDRIALVQKERHARITIDQKIKCSDENSQHYFDNLIILELKFDREFEKFQFMKKLRGMKLYPRRISKYCLSTCKLIPLIKRNNFKRKLHLIERIEKMTV